MVVVVDLAVVVAMAGHSEHAQPRESDSCCRIHIEFLEAEPV
jgi:hypothetical protein